jgi:hypothetical protein
LYRAAAAPRTEDWRVAYCRDAAVSRWVVYLRLWWGRGWWLKDGNLWWQAAERWRLRLIDPHP